MKIIKYYRDEQNINISGYILEIMLYYSLNEYFKDNRYEDYLNGFIVFLELIMMCFILINNFTLMIVLI